MSETYDQRTKRLADEVIAKHVEYLQKQIVWWNTYGSDMLRDKYVIGPSDKPMLSLDSLLESEIVSFMHEAKAPVHIFMWAWLKFMMQTNPDKREPMIEFHRDFMKLFNKHEEKFQEDMKNFFGWNDPLVVDDE